MKITKAVIPAAGFGTRVLPATKNIPKEMFPIVDKPTIQYIVEEAVAAYAALVADISKLMDASVEEDDAVKFNAKQYPALVAQNPDFMADVGIFDHKYDSAETRFLEYIRSAVSYEIVKKPQESVSGVLKDAEYKTDSGLVIGDFVYLDSPYAIYYAWLKNYKYLPKEA